MILISGGAGAGYVKVPVDRRNVRLAVLASTLALIDGSGVGRLDDQLA